MLKKRDAQGLSITAIILAVLALVVLVVVINIFSQKSSESVEALGSCPGKGGECTPNKCGEGEAKIANAKCESTNDVCCIKVFEK